MAPVSAGTLALWIGTGFALAAAVAAFAARAGEPRAWVAGRALAMSAAFNALASGILVDALRRHDLTIDFVARHSTHGVGMATALLGVFADPAGTGLVIASVIGMVGAWLARRADAPGIAGASAVTMIILLAAPLAGRPLAVLPWTPLDGQDALLFFRQGLSFAYVIALVGAMVASTMALGAAIDRWRGQPRGSIDAVSARVALLCIGAAAVTRTWASVAAGLSRDVSPLTALGGAWSIAGGVALVSVLLVAFDRAGSQASVEGALAATLATAGLALTSPSASVPGTSVRVLSFLALGVALVACWHGRVALSTARRGVHPRRLPTALRLASLGAVIVTGVMDLTAGPRRAALPSGGNVTVAGSTLDHLGLSRYEDDDSQVLALALEQRVGGRTRLASAEHREYADSRGALLGGLVRIPAILPGVFTTVVWLEEVQARDDATVVVVERSPLTWWWLALALGALAVVLEAVTGLSPERRAQAYAARPAA